MKNQKYFAFCGDTHTNGWDGFRGSFATIDEAVLFLIENHKYNWAEVVDLEQLKVVWREFGQE